MMQTSGIIICLSYILGLLFTEIRKKIGRSQARLLGVPECPLVSAMVLGGKAVDLPYKRLVVCQA
jgi:hypothetical protein